MAEERLQTGSGDEEGLKPRKHSGCMLAVIVGIMFITVLWTIPELAAGLQTGFLEFGAAFTVVSNLLVIGFCVALLKWKKWGLYGFAAVIVVNLAVSTAYRNYGFVLPAAAVLMLMYNIIRPYWKDME
jgi:hypothetical protein